jgi:hypothetical protein
MSIHDLPTRPQHLFVVRLWAEQSVSAPVQWRGSVEHVASGQRFYFTSLADMNDFIALQLNQPTDSLSKGKTTP